MHWKCRLDHHRFSPRINLHFRISYHPIVFWLYLVMAMSSVGWILWITRFFLSKGFLGFFLLLRYWLMIWAWRRACRCGVTTPFLLSISWRGWAIPWRNDSIRIRMVRRRGSGWRKRRCHHVRRRGGSDGIKQRGVLLSDGLSIAWGSCWCRRPKSESSGCGSGPLLMLTK